MQMTRSGFVIRIPKLRCWYGSTYTIVRIYVLNRNWIKRSWVGGVWCYGRNSYGFSITTIVPLFYAYVYIQRMFGTTDSHVIVEIVHVTLFSRLTSCIVSRRKKNKKERLFLWWLIAFLLNVGGIIVDVPNIDNGIRLCCLRVRKGFHRRVL